MAIVGSNLESKEIGLSIGLSGTCYNTEIDAVTGYLKLKTIDVDAQGQPVYIDEGYWISDVINLGDKFGDFDKVFTTEIINGVSSLSVQTRVSDNGYDWSVWIPVAMDGTIQSDTKQYVQVKINLYAGFVNDVFFVNKGEFIPNDYITQKEYKQGSYVVPTLTSNTSSTTGFAFSQTEYSSSYGAWRVFTNINANEKYLTLTGTITGFLGFYFSSGARVSKYKVRSAGYLDHMIKSWVLQASNDTTNGTDGTWEDLDTQTNQIWSTAYTDKEYTISNRKLYKAYRIKWSENNGNVSWSGIGELNFYEEGTTSLSLKRKYEYDMTLDSTWLKEGSLHRHKITKDEWLRIDKMNVL